jgi:patatin-like phospholipase/acyl hydrolase
VYVEELLPTNNEIQLPQIANKYGVLDLSFHISLANNLLNEQTPHSTIRSLKYLNCYSYHFAQEMIYETIKINMKKNVRHLKMDGWYELMNFEQIIELISDMKTLVSVSVQSNNLSESHLQLLEKCFVVYRNETVPGKRKYLNQVVSVDLSDNPNIDTTLFYRKLQEKRHYLSMEKYMKDTVHLEQNGQIALAIDRLNDSAYNCWHLRSETVHANRAIVCLKKAKQLYTKKYGKKPGKEFYWNLALMCMNRADLSTAQKYLSKFYDPAQITQFIQNKEGNEWKPIPRCKRPVIILSIDGGGLRALAPLRILEYIEEFCDIRLDRKKLDLLAGTNSGGLFVLGLATKNFTVNDGRQLFQDIKTSVLTYAFGKFTSTRVRSALKGAYYSAKQLQSTAAKIIGEDVLPKHEKDRAQAGEPRVFVTGANANRLYLFRNYYHTNAPQSSETFHCKISEAARVTISTPILFRQHTTTDPLSPDRKLKLMDGGICDNNPTLLAYFNEALPIYKSHRDYLIISLGTGKINRADKDQLEKCWWKLKKIPQMLMAMATNSEVAEDYMSAEASTSNTGNMNNLEYLRFNPPGLKFADFDEINKDKLSDFEAIADSYIKGEDAKESITRLKLLLSLVDFDATDTEPDLI